MMGPFDAASIPPAPSSSSPSFSADWAQMPAPASTAGPMATPSFAPANMPHGLPVYPRSSPGQLRHQPSASAAPPIALSLSEDDFKTPAKLADASPTTSSENSTANPTTTAAEANGSTTATTSQKRSSPDAAEAPPAKMLKVAPTQTQTPPRTRPNRSASTTVPMLTSMTAPATTAALQQPFHPPPSSFSSSLPYPSESADLLYEYFPLSMDDWQAPVDAVYRPHVVHHTHMPSDYKLMAARSRSNRYFAAEDVC